MRRIVILAALAWLLGACGYVSEYEKAVYDYEPVYCYQTIGAVQCFKEPNHRDEKRIVNYYGPDPSRYDRPEEPPAPKLAAPAPVTFVVRDPEPIPRARLPENAIGRPWLYEKKKQPEPVMLEDDED